MGLFVCYADTGRVLIPGAEVICQNIHLVILNIRVD